VQLRLGIEEFAPSRSQRRVWRANNDVTGRVGSPDLTSEKWQLYRRYLAHQHDGTMSDNYEDLYNFLYRSPVHTIEVCYELSGRLIGVSLADQSRHSLSSVYMYFDPDHAGRSLGTFSMLWEIDYCRRMIIPYYYLGFYVRNCGKMSYKANFRPHQLLAPDHRWIPGQP
jgi:arginine-tRNA-protein transferase